MRGQKAIYDQKIHGDPYTQGDLVRLHSSSVFVGSCIMSGRCLFKHFSMYPMVIIVLHFSVYPMVVIVLHFSVYPMVIIILINGKKRVQIVHFNRLKLCTPGTRFLDDTLSDEARTEKHELDTSPVESN